MPSVTYFYIETITSDNIKFKQFWHKKKKNLYDLYDLYDLNIAIANLIEIRVEFPWKDEAA